LVNVAALNQRLQLAVWFNISIFGNAQKDQPVYGQLDSIV
jgi:hypothetical protein